MNLVKLMKKEYLIKEKNKKYYCNCRMKEEITIEINNVISKLKGDKKNLNEYRDMCHKIAKEKGFWEASQNIAVKLMLINSELCEALEADRKSDAENFDEEIADTFIRLFDLCGYLKIDIEKEINAKAIINKSRPKLHGKRY